jgi:hypothetical protein
MYVQPGSGPGTATFALHTSTDRINWTLVSSTILALGTSGAWDDEVLWAFNPVAEQIGGLYYALYAAGADAATQSVSTGVATSPDLLNWTKYVGNPVLVRTYQTQAVYRSGNAWYNWFSTSPVGRSTFALNPIETIRYQSIDLLNWTNPVNSAHCSQIFEDVNGVVGQCYPNAMLDIGGQAYMYTTSSISDSANPTLYQIGLAIAPVPLAKVITQREDALQPLVSDGFTSGVGPLSASWTTPAGSSALQIVSGNKAEPAAFTTNCRAVRTAEVYTNDHYSEVTIAALVFSSSFIAPMVRYSIAALNGYLGIVAGPSGSLGSAGAKIFKEVAGVGTQIGPAIGITPAIGDVLRLSVIGNVISLYQNGFLVLQVQDDTFTTGGPGMMAQAAGTLANTQMSLWAGGNANVTPNYSGGSGTADDMLNLTRWCTRIWG